MIFVYVRGTRGPAPEKWPELLRNASNKPILVLAAHSLTPAQAELSIDELAVIFPPPPSMTDDREDNRRVNLIPKLELAHGKTPSEQGGSSV